jgi:hypothetical protein
MKEEKKAAKIKKEIAPILERFLLHDEYQDTFKDMAFALGYKGDDKQKIINTLFSIDKTGNIGFVLKELNEMFFEFQLIENLNEKEPFRTLLEKHPGKKKDIVKLALDISSGKEFSQEAIESIFNNE